MNNEKLILPLKKLREFEDTKKIDEIIELLRAAHGELRGRKNPDLQLSASSLVFQAGQLYFIEHPYQKELLLPAGHVELGEFPLETAIREFHEETGFYAEMDGILVDVNLIKIPFNEIKNEKSHLHIDFRYLLKKGIKQASRAELPVFLLAQQDAPEEFKKYYQYSKMDLF